MQFSREELHEHHRLSHQQIDDYLGESLPERNMAEKINLLGNVEEFLTISDTFRQNNIGFTLVKGPLLSYQIYEDAAYRRSKDLDFLIGFSEMERAIRLLKEQGYESLFYDWPKDTENQKFKKNLRNQYHLYHPKKELSIELHWKLFIYPPIKENKISELVSSHLSEVEYTGRNFTVLNPELNLLYLIIHGGMHAWRRLKWLVDVHEIIKKELYEKENFVELVKQLKAERMVSLCNTMLKSHFQDSGLLPVKKTCPAFMVKHAHHMIHKNINSEYDSFRGIVRYFRFVLLAFPGIRHKINTFKILYHSLQDAGDHRISFLSFLTSFIRPAKFLKKRYRFEK